MNSESQAPIHSPRCGSIQCAVCYPDWGHAYNEAIKKRVIPPAKTGDLR